MNIELIHKDSKGSVFARPIEVEHMKANGWTEKKAIKTESKLKQGGK